MGLSKQMQECIAMALEGKEVRYVHLSYRRADFDVRKMVDWMRGKGVVVQRGPRGAYLSDSGGRIIPHSAEFQDQLIGCKYVVRA